MLESIPGLFHEEVSLSQDHVTFSTLTNYVINVGSSDLSNKQDDRTFMQSQFIVQIILYYNDFPYVLTL